MNVLKEKYNEAKIIFSIVMGFIGIFRHLQVVLSNFDKERY